MKNYLKILAVVILCAGCHSHEIGFIYSPEQPRTGQTVKFTNTSDEGSSWNWSFGDGTNASTKSPSKVYKQAGEYTVTLIVDGKKSRSYSTIITVLDSMPTIQFSDSIIQIYKEITASVAFYNSVQTDVTYRWNIEPFNLTKGNVTDSVISFYCLQPTDSAVISLDITLGTETHTIYKSFAVANAQAQSIVAKTADGDVYRYRIFDSIITNEFIAENSKVFQLVQYDGEIFAFEPNKISTLSGKYNTQLSSNSQPIISGTIVNDSIYWLLADNSLHVASIDMAQIDTDASNDCSDRLPSASVSSICSDDANICYIGQGIIINGKQFLSDYNVDAATIDRINGKIYFIAGGSLMVSNLTFEQSSIAELAKCDGKSIAISRVQDKIYFTNQSKLFSLPLLHSSLNKSAAQPLYMRKENVDVFCFDSTLN